MTDLLDRARVSCPVPDRSLGLPVSSQMLSCFGFPSSISTWSIFARQIIEMMKTVMDDRLKEAGHDTLFF